MAVFLHPGQSMVGDLRGALRTMLAPEARTAPSAADVAAAARRACQRLAQHATPLIGATALAAIGARSLQLTERQFPGLEPSRGSDEGGDACLRMQRALERQAPGVAADAAAAVLTTVAELLTSSIGESLTFRLLRNAWPDAFAGGIAEKTTSDAREEPAQSTSEVADLMRLLRNANERLAAAAEEAGRRQDEYRQLSSRLLTLQDEERRRLALDLHDSTAQRLAALTMNLDMVAQVKGLDARSRRALAESRSLAERCSREVRTLAYLLHPPLLDEAGLLPAVRWYAEGFTKRSGIDVVMDLHEVGRLPVPIETALFRVVQESLTNIHRHAATARASIRLTMAASAIVLEIRDQGRGLSDGMAAEDGTLRPGKLGVGIQGMRERIRQLGGAFDIEFTGQGTLVRVWVPVKTSPS